MKARCVLIKCRGFWAHGDLHTGLRLLEASHSRGRPAQRLTASPNCNLTNVCSACQPQRKARVVLLTEHLVGGQGHWNLGAVVAVYVECWFGVEGTRFPD